MKNMVGMAGRGNDGFTLVELLVVVVVVLILIGTVLPSMRGFIDGRRASVAAAEFMAAIHLARSEAIHRGERVDLMAVDNDWRNGWLVFVDRNRNREPDAGDDVIHRHPPLQRGLEVETRLADSGRNYLAYDPSGRSRTDASARQPQFGTLRIRLGDQRRNVVLNLLGRARLCTPPGGTDSC